VIFPDHLIADMEEVVQHVPHRREA
jgi:hypothetical protein